MERELSHSRVPARQGAADPHAGTCGEHCQRGSARMDGMSDANESSAVQAASGPGAAVDTTSAPVAAPGAAPVGQRPSGEPRPPDLPDPAQVGRKLLMGLALILALTSVYSGVFGAPKMIQMVLAAGATLALVSALRR